MARRSEQTSSSLTIRQLEVFAMACRSTTFSEAAKRLGISQPSLSNTIAKIEEQMGVSLFDRTTRTLALTPEGDQLAAVAESLVRDFQALMSGFGQSADRRRGRVSLAVLPSVAMSVGAKALAAFFATYPDADVAFHDVTQEKAQAWIAERLVDFGVIATTGLSQDVASEIVFRDDFRLICRRDSAFAGATSLTWADLAHAPIIMAGAAPIRRDIEAAWAQVSGAGRPRFEVEQIMTGLALVSEGLGATILPSLYLPTVMDGGLVARPIEGGRLTRDIAIVRRSDRTLSKPAQHLIECLRREFAAFEASLPGRV